MSPYSSIKRMAREYTNYFISMFVPNYFDNKERLKSSKCPILIIHGIEDRIILHEHAVELETTIKAELHKQYDTKSI